METLTTRKEQETGPAQQIKSNWHQLNTVDAAKKLSTDTDKGLAQSAWTCLKSGIGNGKYDDRY
jgi:hypothetical protein